ncbi:hypothetical protein VcTj87_12230 [Vibrio comitans]
MLSGIAYSLVSGVLDSPFSQMLACITLSMIWSATIKTKEYSKRWGIILIITSVLVIILTTGRLSERISNNFYQDEQYAPEVYAPQFWLGNNCTV